MDNTIHENNLKILELQRKIIELEKQNNIIEKKEIDDMKLSDINLNDQQKLAAEWSNGNTIIRACPGSGKTHTLIAKVIYLIKQKKVNPSRIILITFTKKASMEMNERLVHKLGYIKLFHVGTIHALAYRALQKYKETNYTILDDKDCTKGIEDSFEKAMIDNNDISKEDVSLIYKKLPIIHDILTSNYPIDLNDIISSMKLTRYAEIIKKTMLIYQKFKNDNRYLDFNDLMILFLKFLKSDKAIDFINKYDYLMFDEYQDINSIQNMILLEMNKRCNNLTVVGDELQSIYGFRGSNIKYIIDFDNAYSDVKKFYLDKNYRSTPEVINFCNDIIRQNDKIMISTKQESLIKPKIIGFSDQELEIQYIVSKIKHNRDLGLKLKDHVIITRKNRQLDHFELELIKSRINYIKSKGIGILDRIHIKDFLAFLVILVNHKSIIHWKRILKSVNGIGDSSIDKIINHKSNLIDTIRSPISHFGHIIGKKLNVLSKVIIKLYGLHKQPNSSNEICNTIIDYLKPIIKKNMKPKENDTFEDKIDDLNNLKSYISKSESITQFLADVHLSIDIDNKNKFNDSSDDFLLLSTIHGSKGLEWMYVFLSGGSSNIIPSFKPNVFTEELDDIDEEKRLFYVGCSRSKKILEITLSYDQLHSNNNQIYVSPFITSINPELYEGVNLITPERLYKGDITKIVNNYLLLESTKNIKSQLRSLQYIYKSYYLPHINSLIYKHKCEMIYGTFIDNMISKMIYHKYNNIIKEFNVPIYERFNLRKDNAYYDYVDSNNDWVDCIESILKISTKKCKLSLEYDDLKNILLSDDQLTHYKEIYSMITQIISDEFINNIDIHYNLSYGDIMGEADIVVGRTLIEIKASRDCIANVKYLLQTIMYSHLLRKKGINIDKIILVNPTLGESYTIFIFDTTTIYSEIIKQN